MHIPVPFQPLHGFTIQVRNGDQHDMRIERACAASLQQLQRLRYNDSLPRGILLHYYVHRADSSLPGLRQCFPSRRQLASGTFSFDNGWSSNKETPRSADECADARSR